MRRRCYDKNLNVYPDYGGSGVTVCDEWRDSYETFLKDMGECPGDEHFLDRIDGSKGYSPDNCRWATRKEQNSNRCNVRLIEHDGKTLHTADWIKELGLNKGTALDRLWRGQWDIKQALGIYPPPIPTDPYRSIKTGKICPTGIKGHSKTGFSSLARTYKCQAWLWQSRKAPKTTSVYAEEGSLYHSYIERAKRLAEQPQKQARLLKIIQDDDMKEHVVGWLSFLQTVEESLINPEKPFRRMIERRVYLTDEIHGILDYGLVADTEQGRQCVIADAKYGQGELVDAFQNLQLIGYALSLDLLMGLNIDIFHLYIYQPRVDPDEYSRWSITREELYTWKDSIIAKCNRSLALENGTIEIKQEDFSPGEHCRFCPGYGTCEAASKHLIGPLEEALEHSTFEQLLQKLTLDQQVEIFKKKKQIKNFLDAVASNLHTALSAGAEHDGVKLIQTKGRRSWDTSRTEEIAKVLKENGIDPYQLKLIGITEPIKKLGEKVLQEYLIAGEGKIEVVESSDKRPALNVSGMKVLTEEK